MRDAELVPVIRKVHTDNIGVYGARKIHAELNSKGIAVARCTVERLMKAEGLRGISREKTRKTTVCEGAETERPADLVERQFVADAPNQLWVADLTYIRTHSGSVYAAFILDVFSRMGVGRQVSHQLADRPRPRRPRHGPVGPAARRPGRRRADASQRPRSSVSSDSLHRAARRSRGRRVRGEQGRCDTALPAQPTRQCQASAETRHDVSRGRLIAVVTKRLARPTAPLDEA